MIAGLTGGIGSGKSTVARIFAHLGVPVYESDLASRQIIDTDKTLQHSLQLLLGPEVVKEGRIDRPLMASLIFGDEDILQKVNALIHPAVARDFEQWYHARKYPYVIKEAAILFESGSYKRCDKIIVVSAGREKRIRRVMQRNGWSREEVLQRMSRQWPEARKLRMADYVIDNNETRSVIKQVLRIHEDIIRQSDKRS